MGDFIGQVVLLTKHAERKRNSYFRFETGKDKIQYQIGTTRHRNTRSSQLVPIIILENHICDIEYKIFFFFSFFSFVFFDILINSQADIKTHEARCLCLRSENFVLLYWKTSDAFQIDRCTRTVSYVPTAGDKAIDSKESQQS